ncbi:high affinity methionine permease [Metarhizium album ARSEF 1941]|uniref:High affinity methionine permease n=1 Tax=Metarhizium album (strain ARSEF 1941) TaxID=1081103 RepID=A0A0B2X7F1_METAS|nr:high affinity methionine permease [Metarhizium album ARSEF 1941]KHO01430.1 high affinity methionine permease [Metarhizium album ARSEF 1941]
MSDSSSEVVYDGELAFTRAKGGNGSEATYQEAVGAHVDRNSPLGYHVGWVTIIFLNINQMTGTGIFSTRQSTASPPGNTLKATGSVGLALIYGAIGAVMAFGFSNVFKVVNEIKNPVRSIKKHGFASVLIVAMLYMLYNIAYFSAVDKAQFESSKAVAAGVFLDFFGLGPAETALNVLVSLSAFGNIFHPFLGCDETFWDAGRPLSAQMAHEFVVILRTHPEALFGLAMTLGVFVIRRHRSRNKLPATQFRVWNVLLVFYNLVQVFLLVMPWCPYAGDVSFCMAICGLYSVAWMYVIPRWRGYRVRAEVTHTEDDSVLSHKLG